MSSQYSFSVTVNKNESRKTHKEAATESGCSEGPAKHLQGGNSKFGKVRWTLSSHCMILIKLYKTAFTFPIRLVCTNVIDLLKMEVLYIK